MEVAFLFWFFFSKILRLHYKFCFPNFGVSNRRIGSNYPIRFFGYFSLHWHFGIFWGSILKNALCGLRTCTQRVARRFVCLDGKYEFADVLFCNWLHL